MTQPLPYKISRAFADRLEAATQRGQAKTSRPDWSVLDIHAIAIRAIRGGVKGQRTEAEVEASVVAYEAAVEAI